MNNYNYNFPSSGINNWGHGLNSMLKQMQTDISALQETVYAGIDRSVEALTFPYASSGLVGNAGEFYVTFTSANINIRVKSGTYYFGGPKRFLRTVVDTDDINFTIAKASIDKYYYLYLKYDMTNDALTIELNNDLITEWSYIMLGIITPHKEFIPKVYNATKTAMQHIDEDNKRKIEILVDHVEANDSGISFNTNPTITYYGDGVGYSINTTINDIKQITNILGGNLINYSDVFVDTLQNGKLETIHKGTSQSSIFRILLSIDGRFYKQYYYKEYEGLSYDITSENTIKNFGFCNQIDFLRASGFVEICRVLKDKNGKFYLFKTENNGLWGLPNASLWHGYTGQIATSNIIFTGSSDGSNPFQLITSQSYKKYNLPQASSRSVSGQTVRMRSTPIADTGDYEEIDLLINNYAGDKNIVWDFKENQMIDMRVSKNDSAYSSFSINNNELFFGTKNVDTIVSGIQSIDNSLNVISPSGFNVALVDSTFTLSDNRMQWHDLNFDYKSNGYFVGSSDVNKTTMDFNNFKTFRVSDLEVKGGSDITFVSDRRHKENIELLNNNSLNIILNTPVVTYNYIGSNAPQIGIISQDLDETLNAYESQCFIQTVKEDLIPDCRRLKETKLVYILWKALQEEHQKIQKLEEKVSRLLGE